MNHCLKILLLALFPALGNAQQRLRFEHFAAEQGLSQHAIICMVQDHNGFIWIGTQDGLNKYDGYRFTTFRNDPADKMSLSNKYILSLAKDKENNIWVGTQAGLNRLNTFTQQAERFVYSSTDSNTISSDEVKSLFVDHTGLVWAGTVNGLNTLNYQTKKIVRYYHHENDPNSIVDNNILCINEDKKGNVWIGSAKGLNYFDRASSRFTQIKGLPPGSVQCVTEDTEGNIWIGTSNGLSRFEPLQKNIILYKHNKADKNSLNSNNVSGILESEPNILWITTSNGLSVFDKKTNSFKQYRNIIGDAKSLGVNGLNNILKDLEGNIWIGSADGVNKHNPQVNSFSHYFHNPADENSLSHNSVWPVLEDSDGIIWVGTLGRGLNRLDRTNNKWSHYKHNANDLNSLGEDNVWYISEGSNGKLWITTSRGLDCFDRKTGKFEHYDPNKKDSTSLSSGTALHQVIEDSKGNVWVATDIGLDKLDIKTGKFKHFRTDPTNISTISGRFLSCISETRNGKLLIGTFENGFNIYDPERNTFKRFVHSPEDSTSINNRDVYCAREDRNGKIWIGGDVGIDCLDPVTGIAKHYRVKDGLVNETVYGIEEDEKGKLWISTNWGIARLDPETRQFKNFDISDGLQGFEFNGFGSRQNKRTGEMFFGGVYGFNVFHPDSIKDNPYKPFVYINKLKRYNIGKSSGLPAEELLLGSNSITLSYKDNMLSFEFVCLSLSKPAKNQYAYQLKGYSDQWYQLGTKREVTFAGLPPGHYTLFVKGSNGDGVWNDTPAELSITILPPWWKTWWAYTLYALLFLTLLFVFIWYRSRSLKEQNIRLEHKVLVRTDELKQSLENLKSTQSQLIQSEKMASLGELTAGIAHEIQNPLNFVNNFSEVSKELLDEMNDELEKGNLEDVRDIMKDVIQNLEKINHHGKRADGIVKGMLQHSRSSSGVKEPTDINALCDEYLRLSYHGLRAKDKTFNATIKTDFDNSIGNINIIPQDIGRVVLNLLTNAFYVVDEKKKSRAENYEPTVSISTKKAADKVEIRVTDNGNGIPPKVLDKIFQPFFTTKPTGQGTGLGLSLAFDIVTKGHGGELTVETKENEGTTFIIQLPL